MNAPRMLIDTFRTGPESSGVSESLPMWLLVLMKPLYAVLSGSPSEVPECETCELLLLIEYAKVMGCRFQDHNFCLASRFFLSPSVLPCP